MFTDPKRIIHKAIDKKAQAKEIVVGVPKYCLLEIEPVFRDKLGEGWQEHYETLLAWAKTHTHEIPLPRGHILKHYKDYTNDVFDIPIIASAMEWGANYFVTGNLKHYNKEKIETHSRILSLRQFLDYLLSI
jgi:hypothetical protein